MFPVCSFCFSNVKFPADVASVGENGTDCALCLGFLKDKEFCDDIVQKVSNELRKNAYDGNTFIMAINTPVSMHLREIVVEKLLGDLWTPMLMSPKSQLSMLLMSKINEVCILSDYFSRNFYFF